MGLGHVPQEPIRSSRAHPELQGRERRGTPSRRTQRPRLNRSELAAVGEDLAAKWYAARGYGILSRNWRCRQGEIDIVAARADTVVISEVKCRTSSYFGPPCQAVGPDKQRRLRRLAAMWLVEHPGARRTVRFDVVEVLIEGETTRIHVIESAF